MISNIGIFGDSVARGIVLDNMKKRYVFLKDSCANLFAQMTQIPVTNYSKFGCTVCKGEQIIEKHEQEIGTFDYTVLEFGGNDCDFDWRAISSEPDREHLPKTPMPEFERVYGGIIEDVRRQGSQPVLLTLPPLDAVRFFRWVSHGLNPRNILHWLGDVEYIYRWQELYNLAVFRLSAQYHTHLIDIRKAFLQCKNYRELLCEDGMHPNQQGHAVMLKAIGNAIPK